MTFSAIIYLQESFTGIPFSTGLLHMHQKNDEISTLRRIIASIFQVHMGSWPH